MDDDRCKALLGTACLNLWSYLPRDIQEQIFETAIAENEAERQALAVFLHERHARTMPPAGDI